MSQFLLKRILLMIPVMLLVSVVVFFIVHLTPGDPALLMLGEEATPDKVAALREQMGLNRPIPVQYADWLGRAVTGDLGRSLRTNQPVVESIVQRLPVTLELTFLAIVVSTMIALPIGILSAVRRNSAADLVATTAALIGVSLPNFFLAILLIFVFSLNLRWLPPIGFVPLREGLAENLRSMILPAITLGAASAAITTRLTRSSMLDVLGQDYIRTARAKGLRERVVVFRHALRNALVPVLTIVGLQVGALLGGAVITETIFALPGIGRMVVSAIFERDFPMLQGAVLFIALVHLLVNLIVDLLYGVLDPRVVYS